MPSEREQAIASIVDAGRRTRKPTPRWVWITACIVGVACIIGFVLLVTRAPVYQPASSVHEVHGSGFSLGLAAGLCLGLAIGVVIGRQRGARHSARNSP